ncbi:MAG: hypothetical protein J0M15_13500 [Deltaproteobacteria bacterium]|jgi:hypothetical protein|nr:hypothetical protein [Deltaproteobacteria bacterium]
MNVIVKVEGQIMPCPDIPIEIYGTTQRIQRSIKLFILLFFAAVFSLLIPVLHFVLVPGFLISAIAFGIMKFKEVYGLNLSGVKCPSCQSPLNESQINLSKAKATSRVFCFECRKNIDFQIIKNNNLIAN